MSHNKFPLVILFLFVSGCGGGGGSSSVPSAPPVSNPDTTKPVISVPSTLTVVAPNGSGVSDSETEIAAFLAAATASDNVDSNVSISNNAPAVFPLGDTVVTFSAVDAAGNSASATAKVTVVSEIQSGHVVKGPLYRAKVFLDYDGNSLPGNTEPFVYTDTTGAYSLSEDGLAPDLYQVVVVIDDETIDYNTGEGFAAADMQLRAPEGGAMVSPMTTLYSHAKTSLGAAQSLTATDVGDALGLPLSIDILTFNPFSVEAIDSDAIAVEVIAQKIMLSALIFTEAVRSSSGASGDIPIDVAQAAVLDAMVNTLVEASKIQSGGSSDILTSAEGIVNFSDSSVLQAVASFISQDIESGKFAESLTALNMSVDSDVIDYMLAKGTETIEAVAAEFDALNKTQLQGVEMSTAAILKRKAADQIAEMAAALSALKASGASLSSFDANLFLTFITPSGLEAVRAAAKAEAKARLVAKLALLDTDSDGLPNSCNISCLALGLVEDSDDDNDGIVDAADDFPLDSTETIDSDSDGIGDNADPDDDNDGVLDVDDAFPFDPTESSDSDGDGIGDNADGINTSGAFELYGNTVVLQDYNPADQTLEKTAFDIVFADGAASMNLSSAPLNLTNIINGTTSPTGDYSEALLSFLLDDSLPAGDGTGTVDLTITTGSDGVRADNESQLHCQLQINWSSDRANASIEEPAQSISLEVNKAGLKIKTTINEFDIMAVTVDQTSGKKSLDIKLLAALNEGVKVAGSLLGSLLVPRTLHISIATTLPIQDAAGIPVTQFNAVIRLDN